MTTIRQIGATRVTLPLSVGVIAGLSLLLSLVAFRSQLAGLEHVYSNEGISGVYSRFQVIKNRWGPPNVHFVTDMPENLGMDPSKLETLGNELAGKNTDSLLVVKDGKLVYEWYAPDSGVNQRHSTSAMAKAVTASMALAIAVGDGLIDLDDPVSKYIPAWGEDPLRSKILIRQLGSHSSGLDNVSFVLTEEQPEWKETYYQNRELRFPLAISEAPLIVDPGTQYSYSGVGYYVLAYALTSSLKDTSNPNIHGLIENRIMKPLDIPNDAWQLSYGENYEFDGMELYAFGSGARQTARSVAKIGQLVLNGGEWNGQQVIDPRIMELITSYEGSNPGRTDRSAFPPMGIGWHVNDDGFFESLPRDAIIGTGRGPNVTLVIPSMNLVAVRLGGPIIDSAEQSASSDWAGLDEFLFAPLVASVNTQEKFTRQIQD